MSKRTILVVDDDPDVIKILKMILAKDYQVLFAFDGNDAITLVAQHQIDLIITDINMPKADGVTLTKHIAEHAPQIKCVVMTGDANKKPHLLAARFFGAADVLPKPFDVEDVLAVVMKLIGNAHH